MTEAGEVIDLLVLGGGMAGLERGRQGGRGGRERRARREGRGDRRLGRLRRVHLDRADRRGHARGQPGRRPGARPRSSRAMTTALAASAHSASTSPTRSPCSATGAGAPDRHGELPAAPATASCASAARCSCAATRAAAHRGRRRRRRRDRDAPASTRDDPRALARCSPPAASAAIPTCAPSTSRPQARDIPLRANLNSTGDGLRLGRAAGARRAAERRLLRPPDPVGGRLHEPVRVHRPDLLPLRARRAAQPGAASASATRRSAITSARCTCSISPRRGRC